MLRPETANTLLRLEQGPTSQGASTQTETEIDKMTTVLNGIIVLVQDEHLLTILSKPCFIGLGIGLS